MLRDGKSKQSATSRKAQQRQDKCGCCSLYDDFKRFGKIRKLEAFFSPSKVAVNWNNGFGEPRRTSASHLASLFSVGLRSHMLTRCLHNVAQRKRDLQQMSVAERMLLFVVPFSCQSTLRNIRKSVFLFS
jgi:hypothetical protein